MGKITGFLDHMTPELKKATDVSVAKMIFSLDLPAETVESEYLKDFIKNVRPSYNLPSAHQVKNELLDDVFNEIQLSHRAKALQKGTIILTKKESMVSFLEILWKFFNS